VPVHLDIGCYMTSVNDIKLRLVDDPVPEENKLPFGVYMINIDGRIIFVRRFCGRFMPVSSQEQEELCQQFLL